MRTLKLAEKQDHLKNVIQSMKPIKINFGGLPTITEKQQNQSHFQIKSCQDTPKVFINTEQAMIWIKKDIDKKNRHDLFEMIKKKAEKELILEKSSNIKIRERKPNRNFSHTLRKYSSTSRCPVDNKVNNRFNMTQNFEQKRQNTHFLRIKVLETFQHKPTKSNNKLRNRTQKSKNETISFSEEHKSPSNFRNTIRIGSERTFFKRQPIPSNQSFNQQFLTPW